MRHRNKKKILGLKSHVRKSLLRNQATSLILYEKITTTKAKAKLLQSYVEKLITYGKENTLSIRRRLQEKLYSKKAASKVLEVLGPRFKEKKGGYTNIINLGKRKGDAADIAIIQFLK